MGRMGRRDGEGHPTNNFSKALDDSGLTVCQTCIDDFTTKQALIG